MAELRCRAGDYGAALEALDEWAECGSLRSKLAAEDCAAGPLPPRAVPSYDWLRTPDGRRVAARTAGDVPVLDAEDVAMLRAAADDRFARAAGRPTSRYTMQYEGNSEVHLDDLCANDPALRARVDRALRERVYPLVRAAFDGDEGAPAGPLCVYDSIFVRYNGDDAAAAGRGGASQPLHQDGGIYSVNVALNAHRDDDHGQGFTGGGTFLESLIVGEGDPVQRPAAPGHAIIHKTTERHA